MLLVFLAIIRNLQSVQKNGNRTAMPYDGWIIWDGLASEPCTSDNEYLDQLENGHTDGPIEMTLRF